MIKSGSSGELARSAFWRWLVATTIWYATDETLTTGIQNARSGSPVGIGLSIYVGIISAMAGVLFGGIILFILIFPRYLITRKKPQATFWAAKAQWRDVLIRAVGFGLLTGSVFGFAAPIDASKQALTADSPQPAPSATAAVPTTDAIRHVARIIIVDEEHTQAQLPSSERKTMPLSEHFMHTKACVVSLMEALTADKHLIRIDDIRGRVVDVTATYDSPTNGGGSLSFLRRETWTFIHGKAGWMQDGTIVDDLVLTAVTAGDKTRTAISDSHYDPATGKVQFSENGYVLAWVPLPNLSWRIDTISSPSTPEPVAVSTPEPTLAADGQSQQQATTSTTTSANESSSSGYEAPAATQNAEEPNNCTSEDLDTVSDDGSFIKLLDGRKFVINDADRATTSVWLAPGDVTVCDPGPGSEVTIEKDGDTVHAGHIDQ